MADFGEADAAADVVDHPERAVAERDEQGKNERGVAAAAARG